MPSRSWPLGASVAMSSLGDGAFAAAAPLLTVTLTRDPMDVAVVGFVSAVPWFTVGIVSGAWVDRLPRRLVLIAADVVRALTLTLLAGLVAAGRASVALIAAVWFVVVSGRCFFDPAAQAALPALVGRDRHTLAHLNGRLAVAETLGASLAGPPLGGLLFGLATWSPFAMDAASFAASFAVLLALPRVAAPEAVSHAPVSVSVVAGLRYLSGQRRLMTLAGALAVYNLAYTMAMAMLVLAAQDDLHLSARGFGLLIGAMALGAVLVGLRSRWAVTRLSVRRSVLVALGSQGLGWLAVALAGQPSVGAVGMVLVGGGSSLLTVAVVTERQRLVPDELMGRVVSAFRVIGNGVASLGAVAGGGIALVWSARAAVGVAGVVLMVSLVAFWVGFRRVSGRRSARSVRRAPTHERLTSCGD